MSDKIQTDPQFYCALCGKDFSKPADPYPFEEDKGPICYSCGRKTQTTPSIEDFLSRLIKEHSEFSRNWYIIGIVDGYKGEKEDSDNFEYIYVDQSGPMTDAGDDFRGNCYIEISQGKYLKTEYYT